jgi:hypothetical protein
LANCTSRKSTTDSIFAVVLGGTKHNVVTAPGVTKQILNQRSTLSNTELTYYLLTKFFGDRGTIRGVDPQAIFHDIAKQLHGLMREPFLSNAIAVTVRRIEELTPYLVSFAGSVVDQTVWERAAHLEVVPSSAPTVEASLFPLVRNFVGDLACEVLMGRNFMEVRSSRPAGKLSRQFITSAEGPAKVSTCNTNCARTIRIFSKICGHGTGNSTSFCWAFRPGCPDWRRQHKRGNGHAEQSKSTKKLCSLWKMVEILEVDGTTCPMFRWSWPTERGNGGRPMPVP